MKVSFVFTFVFFQLRQKAKETVIRALFTTYNKLKCLNGLPRPSLSELHLLFHSHQLTDCSWMCRGHSGGSDGLLP